MNSPFLIIEIADPASFDAVQEFYTSVNYKAPIAPDSLVLVARENNRIIGAVRLCMEERVMILRGMMISPDREGHGIGTLLLREMEKHMSSRDCFCLPHKWLEGFFGQIGFQRVPADSLPPFLQQRIKQHRASEYPNLIAMRRPATNLVITADVNATKGSA